MADRWPATCFPGARRRRREERSEDAKVWSSEWEKPAAPVFSLTCHVKLMQPVVDQGRVTGALAHISLQLLISEEATGPAGQPTPYPETLEDVPYQVPQEAAGEVQVGCGEGASKSFESRPQVLGCLCKIPLKQERRLHKRTQTRNWTPRRPSKDGDWGERTLSTQALMVLSSHFSSSLLEYKSHSCSHFS